MAVKCNYSRVKIVSLFMRPKAKTIMFRKTNKNQSQHVRTRSKGTAAVLCVWAIVYLTFAFNSNVVSLRVREKIYIYKTPGVLFPPAAAKKTHEEEHYKSFGGKLLLRRQPAEISTAATLSFCGHTGFLQ